MATDKINAILAEDLVDATLTKLESSPSLVTRMKFLLGIGGTGFVPSNTSAPPPQSRLVNPALIGDSVIGNLESYLVLNNRLRVILGRPILNLGTVPASPSPVITGDLHVGSTLSLSPSYSFSGTEPLSVLRQWYYLNGADIPGADTDTYTLTVKDIGKQIAFRAIGTNFVDSVTVFTAVASGVILAAGY